MTILRCLFGLALSLLVLSGYRDGVHAQEPQRELNACVGNWPMYSYEDKGELKGASVSSLKVLAQRTGYKLNLQLLPWARCLRMVYEGKMDMTIDSFDRDGYLVIPTPSSTSGVFILSKIDDTYWRNPDRKKIRLVLYKGFKELHETASPLRNDTNLDVIYVDQFEQVSRMFERGRADMTYISSVFMIHYPPDHPIRITVPTLKKYELFPLVSAKRPDLFEIMAPAFEEMANTGALDEISRKELGYVESEVIAALNGLPRGTSLDKIELRAFIKSCCGAAKASTNP